MWDYSEKVIEYYRNPKNVGEIENPDAIGEVGSISCGDALKLYLKIDNKTGIVTDAKFQTFGCGSAVASASALTEMIIGKPLSEVEKITNRDIADFLGGLPEAKMHCSVMGKEALEAAIANYKGEPAGKKEIGKVVCKCFGVTEEKIRQVIQDNQLNTVEEVTNFSKAGGGCGRCIPDIQKILDEELARRAKLNAGKTMTKTQLIIKVNNVLENYIASELRKDGGGIELIDIIGNKVQVRLFGSCKECKRSNITLKNFVEKIIKEQVDNNLEVEAV